MYVIKVDGQVFYSPALSDAEYQIVSPKLKYEINKSDALAFMLPPIHAMKDALSKMKSVITVEQDGEEIFRGRAYEATADFYNQHDIRCEGEMSYLLDSLQRPYKFDGTAADFFRLMITNHNAQVDADKQFVVGTISAVTDENTFNTESTDYRDTLNEMRSFLVNRYGGYLRVRRENGVRYIDYLDKYNETSNQKIEFGVNLLDIENHINAQDIFTVLVPLSDLEDTYKTLTIESVNNGKDYIESAEGIAKYGRIVKYYVWRNITDPARLLELGQEKLRNAGTLDTLTITAVDLHLLNVDTDTIHLGDTVHVYSTPHGIDKEMICSAIEIDLFDPENTVYTFGEIEQTLSGSLAESSKRSSSNSNHIKQTQKSLNIYIEDFDEVNTRLSSVEFNMDAVEAEILLRAKTTTVDALTNRVSEAEAAITINANAITSKVSKDGVISSINQTAEEVTIKANKINLSGYVTTSKLEAKLVDVGFVDAGRLEVGQFASNYADLGQTTIGRLTLAGKTLSTTSGTFVTAVTLPTVSTDYITYMDENMDVVQQKVVTGFYQGSVTSGSLNYVSHYTTS